MANHERRFVFPLTSLQIGDMQSYLSHLNLFLAPKTGKFYILVDNRPWLQDLVSRSTHWWQLMVTKSRLSPFANTRGMKEKETELSEMEASSSSSDEKESGSFRNWFSFMDAVMMSRKRALLPVKKLGNSLIANSNLHRTLYGYIVFEIAWADVRGINYLNELQTETSLAIEAKIMRRWEFDSISQASTSIASWFPGTLGDRFLLKEHLDATIGEVYHDAQESFLSTPPTHAHSMHPPTPDKDTPDNPNKRRKIVRSIYFDSELGLCSCSGASPIEVLLKNESPIEPTLYRDVLILFRFNDPDLPFELRDIIMSKLRLLTLLEAGLPSWVIFLQSYPGFCRLYRPWMCPLARGVYVLISVVTVLIGFYDLYKNVPLLKTAASNLFGPLFDWVEEWEMISRIKYLGTMLFLHNFQKAVKGFLVAARTVVKFVSFFVRPMAEPFYEFSEMLVPAWMTLVGLAGDSVSTVWMGVESCFTVVGDFLEILLLPVWYISMLARNLASSFIYPIFWVLLYAPFKLVLGLYSLVSVSCSFLYDLFDDIWISARGIFQLTKGVNSKVSSVEVSVWRSLWKDLFSQLFRALRSILHGFVAFFTACNRHRLSIYNHVAEFARRLLQAANDARSGKNIPGGQIEATRKIFEPEKSPHEQILQKKAI